jgi:hypothetical protein
MLRSVCQEVLRLSKRRTHSSRLNKVDEQWNEAPWKEPREGAKRSHGQVQRLLVGQRC